MVVDLQAELVEEQAKRYDDKAHWFVSDLSQITASAAKEIVDATTARFGSVDILVNNAGILHQADFLDFPEDAFERTFQIKVKAAFLIGQAAARAMVEQGRAGAIVNMSSINAILANPSAVAYAVSKGAIKQLTAVMAVALIPHGIRVNAVGPGTIMTDLAQRVVMSSPEARKMVLSRTPQGRLGEPSEVASVVSFLASDDASYIVGQTIYPDGGRLVLNYTVPVKDCPRIAWG
jgi:glucose 1-dehydrogenase